MFENVGEFVFLSLFANRKLGEPLKAEGFLLDAMKMYKQEGWDILADGVRILVAQCQKKLDNTLKYPLIFIFFFLKHGLLSIFMHYLLFLSCACVH